MLYPVELQTQLTAPGETNMGGRRDSNPQQPEPQSGALPLSYGHHYWRKEDLKIRTYFCKQMTRLSPRSPLILAASGKKVSPQRGWRGASRADDAGRSHLAFTAHLGCRYAHSCGTGRGPKRDFPESLSRRATR